MANQLAEFKKQMRNAKNPYICDTPVMAGMRLKDLPPEDEHDNVPLLKRFVKPSDTQRESDTRHEEPADTSDYFKVAQDSSDAVAR